MSFKFHLLIFRLSVSIFISRIVGSEKNILNNCAILNFRCNPNLPHPCCDQKNFCHEEPAGTFKCVSNEIIRLGMFCSVNKNCDAVLHAECSEDKICVCQSRYIQKNNKCVPLLGECCWLDGECATDNSVCIDNICQCRDNYFRLFDRCILNILGTSCSDDAFCEQIKFSKCSENKICSCTSNTTKVNSNLCAPILNGFCWHDNECLPDNSNCIDNKCQCIAGFTSESNYKCVPTVSLWKPCNTSQQCNDLINHSICSATIKMCVCEDNYFSIDDICAPLLNGFCSDTDLCKIRNSECIDGRCRCKSEYVYDDMKCKPTVLNGNCDTDQDCIQIKYSKCSAENKCICDNNYIILNETSCGSLLEGFCQTDEQCIVPNSICTDNKCQCKSDFLPKANNSQCEELFNQYCLTNEQCRPENSVCIDTKCRYLGMNCLINRDCIGILHASCSKSNSCSCRKNYYDLESVCVPLLGGYCNNSTECFVSNSICVKHRCQCKLDYKSFDNDQCQALYLQQDCNYDEDCENIQFARCSNDKKCVCKSLYVAFGSNKCLGLIGKFCRYNEDCFFHKSVVCVHNKCQCPSNYLPLPSRDQCKPVSLGNSCRKDSDCSPVINTQCSKNKICVCKNNTFALNEYLCVPFLNESCSLNIDCSVNSSLCIDNKCQCQPHYSLVSNTQCLKNDALFTCNIDIDCGDPWHSKCLENKKCGCNSNNILIDKSTCSPILLGYCWTNKQCIVKNSACFDFHCQCKSNFVSVSNNLCIPL